MSIDPKPFVYSTIVTEPLNDPDQRRQMGLPDTDDEPMPVVVELNLRHARGLPGARERFEELYREVVPDESQRPTPEVIANTYERCVVSVSEVRDLVGRDSQAELRERAIYRVWPDFPVEPLIYRSISTVKGDAARRSFDATGRSITWAVIDSGIDGDHPHFKRYETLKGDVEHLHKDFTGGNAPLADGFGHGTHVAGIIAGGLPDEMTDALKVVEHVGDEFGNIRLEDQTAQVTPARMSGVAPSCKLVSLKAMDDNGKGSSTNVLKALEYVREEINGNGKLLRIHGVNLSLGYEFLAEWFACGQSPLCVEVDRLVRSGVVVVAAAGNTGYGVLSTFKRQTKTGLALTINDPGNARLAITVGATHRDRPHTYGVSFFSSKGPTADGRPKPDLVAPGERITSCAAGKTLKQIWNGTPMPAGAASYVDDSGTSMAAPHVSGAIAAFLSVHQEYIGRPEEVKQVFLNSATSLDRESYFQGHGLVDLMRAIQSV